MISPAYCVTMADYNAWMNARLCALCATLSDADRKKDLGAFFRSIHGTLNHLLCCDLQFLASFTQDTDFIACEGDLHDRFDDLYRHRLAVDARLQQWSLSIGPAWLEAPSTYTHGGDGAERTVTRGFWVVHMFNHQTHHRGQVTTLLSQLGHDIGSTDLHMSATLPGPGGLLTRQ